MSKESKQKHKKWKEEQKEKSGSLKKPKTCKGGKPHNFVLVLPSYIQTRVLTTEEIQHYYKLEEQKKIFLNILDEAHKKLGIKYSHLTNVYYFYKCSICGKEKYEDKLIV